MSPRGSHGRVARERDTAAGAFREVYFPERARFACYEEPDMGGNGAIIVGDYRYSLWRTWDVTEPRLLWILLNPSYADGENDDQTLRRCRRFSQQRNCGGLEIVNLFAYRTPDPETLLHTCNPVGDENDEYVKKAIERATVIVVAWGAWGAKGMYRQRAQAVLTRLSQYPEKQLLCLGITLEGCPRHPCRMATDTLLRPFR